MNARAHGKALSLSYRAIVVFEQLIPFIKGSFSRNVLNEITRITDAWKKNAHDQNERTISGKLISFKVGIVKQIHARKLPRLRNLNLLLIRELLPLRICRQTLLKFRT